MNLAATSATRIATDPPAGPTSPRQAAEALVSVPQRLEQSVFDTTMKLLGARRLTASQSELVTPFLGGATPERIRMEMLDAISGAIGLVPELESRSAALRQAADAITGIVGTAVTRTKQEPVTDAYFAIGTPYAAAVAPLIEAADYLVSLEPAAS